jgi:hypothetical protein
MAMDNKKIIKLIRKQLAHHYASKLLELDDAIEAIKRKNAAKGLLNSGATLKSVREECKRTVSELKRLFLVDIADAISEGVIHFHSDLHQVLHQIFVDDIMGEPSFHDSRIKQLTQNLGLEHLADRLLADIILSNETNVDELKLKLELQFSGLEARKNDVRRSRVEKALYFIAGALSGPIIAKWIN